MTEVLEKETKLRELRELRTRTLDSERSYASRYIMYSSISRTIYLYTGMRVDGEYVPFCGCGVSVLALITG